MHTILFFLLATCIAVTNAQDVTSQTSWFKGPGHTGSFSHWSDDWFASSVNVDYRSVDGILSLAFDSCLIDSSLQSCSYMKAIDFDFDGDEDLFAATETDGVLKWYENAGSGAVWQEHFIADSIDAIYRFDLADFFSDGVPDLAAVYRNDGALMLFEYSDFIWTGTVMDNTLSEPIGLCIADINSDSLQDIVVTEREEGVWGGVSWYENTGTSPVGWTKHTISTNMVGPSTVYASDYDYDGDQDLCVVDLYGNAVYLCQNEYPAQAWTQRTVAEVVYPEAAPFADIDGSGNLDIVIAELGDMTNPPYGALYWAREESNGEWLLQDLDSTFYHAHWCASVDMDEDGDQDVYATQVTNNPAEATWCTWWENRNSGTQWVRHNIWLWGILNASGRLGRFIEHADFNGDGSIDFAVAPYCYGTTKAAILWVDPARYSAQASLTSSILSKSSPSDWLSFSWNAICPSSTAVCFQVRTGDSPTALGNWSDTLFTPGNLDGYVEDGNSFFQYKVIMHTDNPSITPVLNDLSLSVESMGIEQGQCPDRICYLTATSNPSGSPLVLDLVMNQTADVELTCFDISGRSVWNTMFPMLATGTHKLELPNMPSGLYLVKLKVLDEVHSVEVILLD